MTRFLRRIFIFFVVLSVGYVSMNGYAADDDILNFLPAMVKTQSDITGTYKGAAIGTYGSCACTITDMTITVSDGPISGAYIVGYAIDYNNTQCSGSCGISHTMSSVPAIAMGDTLSFASVYYSTWTFDGSPVQMLSHFSGEATITNGQLKFVTKSTYAQVDDTTNGHHLTTVVGGTLTKQ